jgi:cysteinyl-tRNA synthetase
MLNVSPKSVQRAKEVLDKAAPKIRDFVESGKVAVSAGAEVAKLPEEKQAELNTPSAVAKAAKQAKQAREKAEEKAKSGSSEEADEIDELVDSLINKLKELKAKKPEEADADVANLIRRLHDADLWTEPKKKAA